MAAYEYSSNSGVYNQPILRYPVVSGLTVPGQTSTFDIPLLLTVYNPPRRNAKLGTAGAIPIIDEASNLSYGGQMAMAGNVELAKIHLEGTIDTPTTNVSGFMLSTVVSGSIRLTFADVIATYFEGRAAAAGWSRINPTFYRDPYGRVFNNPVVLDFTANYVENVPARTSFSMDLKVRA